MTLPQQIPAAGITEEGKSATKTTCTSKVGNKNELSSSATVSGSSASSGSSVGTSTSSQSPSPPPASPTAKEETNLVEPVTPADRKAADVDDTTKVASLSSYIQRSLSGIFSDVAMVVQAAEETEQIVDTQPIYQQQGEVAETFRADSDVTAAATPTRKRSRLDLEGDGHQDNMKSQENCYPASNLCLQQQESCLEHSSSRKSLRRQSFSYQCLNKLFNIDNDNQVSWYDPDQDPLLPCPPAHERQQQHQQLRQSSSPRTVAANDNNDNSCSNNKMGGVVIGTSAHHHLLEDDAPFQLPQPPLEESESMNSFIEVLGAVDLDTTNAANDDDDAAYRQPNGEDTVDNGASFGWYITETGQQKSSILSQAKGSAGASAVVLPSNDDPIEETGELEEHARAADTVDNVLGDFFG